MAGRIPQEHEFRESGRVLSISRNFIFRPSGHGSHRMVRIRSGPMSKPRVYDRNLRIGRRFLIAQPLRFHHYIHHYIHEALTRNENVAH
jgi:hypothetical protein